MLENTEEVTSECILTWACRVEAQRAQRNVLSSIKEAREFDAIWHNSQKIWDQAQGQMQVLWDKPCTEAVPWYREKWGKANHFKMVCRFSLRQLGNWQAKKVVDEVHQEDEISLTKQEQFDQRFDVVWVKYIYLDSIKSVILTKLESSTSQTWLWQMASWCHSTYSLNQL